jgi:hypothetical protein
VIKGLTHRYRRQPPSAAASVMGTFGSVNVCCPQKWSIDRIAAPIDPFGIGLQRIMSPWHWTGDQRPRFWVSQSR